MWITVHTGQTSNPFNCKLWAAEKSSWRGDGDLHVQAQQRMTMCLLTLLMMMTSGSNQHTSCLVQLQAGIVKHVTPRL